MATKSTLVVLAALSLAAPLALARPHAASATRAAAHEPAPVTRIVTWGATAAYMPHLPSNFLSMSAGVDRLDVSATVHDTRATAAGITGACDISDSGGPHSAAAALILVGAGILLVSRRRWS